MNSKRFGLSSLLTIVVASLGGCPEAGAQEARFQGIPERLLDGVVMVTAWNNGVVSTGTGFVAKDDLTIITNDHVIEGANTVFVLFRYDRSPIQCQFVDSRPGLDLAAVRPVRPPSKMPPVLSMEDGRALLRLLQDILLLGQIVIQNQADQGNLKLPWSAHLGKVSALDRPRSEVVKNGPNEPDATIFQMNVTATHGMSGSPLINDNARVVGVLFAGVDYGVSQITFGLPHRFVSRLDINKQARPFQGQNAAPSLSSDFAGPGVRKLNEREPVIPIHPLPPGLMQGGGNPPDWNWNVGALNWGPVPPDPDFIYMRYIADKERFSGHFSKHVLIEVLQRHQLHLITNPFFKFSVLVPDTFSIRERVPDPRDDMLITTFENPEYPFPLGLVEIATKKIPAVKTEDLGRELHRRADEFLRRKMGLHLQGRPEFFGDPPPAEEIVLIPEQSDRQPRFHESGRGVRYFRRYRSLTIPDRDYAFLWAIVDDVFIVAHLAIRPSSEFVDNRDLVERFVIQTSISITR